jgi:multidrug resistance efflux pump
MNNQAARRLLAAFVAMGMISTVSLGFATPAFAKDEMPNIGQSTEKSSEKPAEKKEAKKDTEKKPVDPKAAETKKAEKPAEAKKEEPKKEAADKPATYKVKKMPFRIQVDLDGIFEAQNQVELSLRPQEWPSLVVLKAVEHGAVVKQGDLVMAFDTDKIDRTLVEFRSDLQLAELSLKQSEQLMAAMEKLAPLDAALNERAQRIAQEDYSRYQQIDKPLLAKSVDYRLKASEEELEYAQEEYRQLEKMYKADDLAEDSEKIVLRRAKNAVDRAELSLSFAKANHEQAVKLGLARDDEQSRDAVQRAMIDAEHARVALPLVMSKHRIENEKLQIACKQADEKLQKLLSDRASMTVKAPIDGVVYYGRPVRGKWVSSNSSGEPLRRGTPVMPNDVFMTIVQARPLTIRATLPESQVQFVHAGATALVEPAGFAPRKLSALVQHVAAIPLTGGGFDTQLTIDGNGLFEQLMPGMTCDVKMIPYKKTDALTVPPKTIFSDDFDPAKQYVYLLGKDSKPEKRTVTLGYRNDKQVEIAGGLAEGDQILLEKPKEE